MACQQQVLPLVTCTGALASGNNRKSGCTFLDFKSNHIPPMLQKNKIEGENNGTIESMMSPLIDLRILTWEQNHHDEGHLYNPPPHPINCKFSKISIIWAVWIITCC